METPLKEIPTRLHAAINKYKESVFNRKIGTFKDFKIKLHIDKKVKPGTPPERRIPFSLPEKVQRKLEKLKQHAITEDVTGKPTPWFGPLVAVNKDENNVRICGYIRCANKVIQRTQYPVPTLDNMVVKLKGAKHSTKLDLRSAFHQLELDEKSRYCFLYGK